MVTPLAQQPLEAPLYANILIKNKIYSIISELGTRDKYQSWAHATNIRAGHKRQISELGTRDKFQSWAHATNIRAGHMRQISELGTRKKYQSWAHATTGATIWHCFEAKQLSSFLSPAYNCLLCLTFILTPTYVTNFRHILACPGNLESVSLWRVGACRNG